jgi:hypothetical protein
MGLSQLSLLRDGGDDANCKHSHATLTGIVQLSMYPCADPVASPGGEPNTRVHERVRGNRELLNTLSTSIWAFNSEMPIFCC